MTSVEVICVIGSFTAPRCSLDIFSPGELTVTSQECDTVLRVFRDGEWLSATAYTEGTNYPEYWFQSRLVAERAAAAMAKVQAVA